MVNGMKYKVKYTITAIDKELELPEGSIILQNLTDKRSTAGTDDQRETVLFIYYLVPV